MFYYSGLLCMFFLACHRSLDAAMLVQVVFMILFKSLHSAVLFFSFFTK